MIQQPYPARRMAPFRDREHAARLLVTRLKPYQNTNAVILAVPPGGVPVGHQIAQDLDLPMDLLPCRRITHPGDPNRSIGSVCLKEVVIHDNDRDIPQEYIQYAVNNLRTRLRRRQEEYKRNEETTDFQGKTVIIVSDWLKTGDTILACLRNIRRQRPERIVVAAPIITPRAHKALSREVDEVFFLVLDGSHHAFTYKYFPPVTEEEVRRIVGSESPANLADKDFTTENA